MKHFPNQTHASLLVWSVPHAVVFEVAIAIVSALVIFTSCWVLKYVYLKETRSRTDLLFAITSVTDIGVGFLILPFAGVDVACTAFIKCSAPIPYLINAFNFFPVSSYFNTIVIAIDRLLLITKHYKYKTFVTTKRLKIIVAFLFVFCIGFTFLPVYYLTYCESHYSIFRIVVFSFLVVVTPLIVVTYSYISCYVNKRSNAILHCKVSGKDNNKRLTKTIMLIIICQVIFILPMLSLQLLLTLDIFYDFVNADLELHYFLTDWFFIFESCQFFVNGIILLISQRENNKKR